jgi:hypothetical protein
VFHAVTELPVVAVAKTQVAEKQLRLCLSD